jgi:hypothetical protein
MIVSCFFHVNDHVGRRIIKKKFSFVAAQCFAVPA